MSSEIERRTTEEEEEEEEREVEKTRNGDEMEQKEQEVEKPLIALRSGKLGCLILFINLVWVFGMFSIRWVLNRHKHGSPRGLYIHPADRLYRAWEMFILMWSLYSCFFTTVEFAFFRGLPHHLSLLDTVGQAAFYMHIFLQFFVAYIHPYHISKMVTSRQSIAIRYLTSYNFIFELLPCMPWDNIYKASGRREGVRCLLLIRLLRARKVIGFLSTLDYNMRVNNMVSLISKLVAAKIYCTHIAACILYYLATTLPTEKEEYTWIGSLKLGDYSYTNFREIGLMKRYTTALYFAVGYGNIQAVSLREIIFVMAYVSFDTVLVAYLIGNVTALIITRSYMAKYKDKRRIADKFLSRYSRLLSTEISRDVRYTCFQEFNDNNKNDIAFIQDLPNTIRGKAWKENFS